MADDQIEAQTTKVPVNNVLVDKIYQHMWDWSDGITAKKILAQAGSECAQEDTLLAVVAKNNSALYAATKDNANGTRTDTIWMRYNETALPALILDNVPKKCP